MKTMGVTQAKARLSAVLDDLAEEDAYTVITRRGKPSAVVMSLDSFNSMVETLHLLSTPANAAHLAASVAQHKQGLL